MAKNEIKVPTSLSLPLNMLFEVDNAAGKNGDSRSGFIVGAIKEKLEKIKSNKKQS